MNLKRDIFNSDIFGIQMANIVCLDGIKNIDGVRSLIREAVSEGYDNLSVKIDTSEISLINSFLNSGFELVDTLITYAIPVDNKKTVSSVEGIEIRKAFDEDVPAIMKIAKSAFKIDQFHSDRNLPSEKADIYYEQWAKNSCEGFADDVFVIEDTENKQIAGFITVNYTPDSATVGLAAIDAGYHGRGVFTYSLSLLLDILSSNNKKTLFYGTQLANLAVLKTMAKFSGVPQQTKHIMHKMITT